MEDVLVDCLYYCLPHRRAIGAEAVPISDVHLVVYIWGLNDAEISGIDKERVCARVSDKLVLKKGAGESDRDESEIVEFVDQHWHNVHILGTKRLLRWVPESFLPFPMLLERLEADSPV